MAVIIPSVSSGSFLQFAQLRWAPLYEAVLRILNDASNAHTILPFGDPMYGQPNATTFTGARYHASGLAPTWTWSEAPSGFDTPLDLTKSSNWQGIVPLIQLNGTDEGATSPDNDFWTRGDGAADSVFSFGAWLYVVTGTGTRTILSKEVETTGSTQREWGIHSDYNNGPGIKLKDESAGSRIERYADTNTPTNLWRFTVFTYDATEAHTGIKIYIDGASVATTGAVSGSYTAMENTTAQVRFGSTTNGAGSAVQFYSGKMAGGPVGPFFVQAELTAAQIKNLYEIGRRALGLM